MKTLLLSLFTIGSIAFAHESKYDQIKNMFEAAQLPKDNNASSTWAGRCYLAKSHIALPALLMKTSAIVYDYKESKVIKKIPRLAIVTAESKDPHFFENLKLGDGFWFVLLRMLGDLSDPRNHHPKNLTVEEQSNSQFSEGYGMKNYIRQYNGDFVAHFVSENIEDFGVHYCHFPTRTTYLDFNKESK